MIYKNITNKSISNEKDLFIKVSIKNKHYRDTITAHNQNI